ncbi:FCPF [Symbiodinium pilosum]|uniref:FCPF protein n=1 Tax=Symbiodinium pilosum TaxID=2952 RepID=A0A812LRT4_SYMPI|nr:FCPF [Symbiodinium pilosum]
MASVKNMLAAGLLAAPCADAFVAPGISQVQGATLRGSAGVQSESCFGAKSALAAASAGAVALSFIGAQRPVARKQKVVCNFSKESQIGAMDPLGYFDPLDLCKDEATFKDFRAKEIKHGRLAMMGALGMLTQSLVQLPGFEGVPKDVSACTVGAGQTGFLITIAIIAVLEATEPGNFGNPLPLVGDDYSDEMRARELNNGRIAMFAAIGQIAAGLYTGKSGIEQFGA